MMVYIVSYWNEANPERVEGVYAHEADATREGKVIAARGWNVAVTSWRVK